MNQLITLLKNKSVLWALVVSILSVLQGYLFEFNLTPIHQMIAGIVIAVVVVLLKFTESV
jgi:hypothetical protein